MHCISRALFAAKRVLYKLIRNKIAFFAVCTVLCSACFFGLLQVVTPPGYRSTMTVAVARSQFDEMHEFNNLALCHYLADSFAAAACCETVVGRVQDAMGDYGDVGDYAADFSAVRTQRTLIVTLSAVAETPEKAVRKVTLFSQYARDHLADKMYIKELRVIRAASRPTPITHGMSGAATSVTIGLIAALLLMLTTWSSAIVVHDKRDFDEFEGMLVGVVPYISAPERRRAR